MARGSRQTETVRRFFCENITEAALLEGEQAAHMARVLRMKEGDEVILFDGSGMDYVCVIESLDARRAALRVLRRERNRRMPPITLTLYAAAIKHDKLALVVQKATELGARRICLFNAERSVKRVSADGNFTDKLKKVAVEAAKQCERSEVPAISVLADTAEVAKRLSGHTAALFCYEESAYHIKKAVQQCAGSDWGVIVGPEGGFAREEAALLTQAGAVECSLGSLILRAETASVAALAMVLFDRAPV